MRDKSYPVNHPELSPIEENGWNLEEGAYVPVRCITIPASKGVIELTKCFCKSGCKGRCSCSKNGLPCTPLCKCYVGDCENVFNIAEHDDDDGDGEVDDLSVL